MIPTNSNRAKDKGCSPVSSNCVVWQGPDLPCIDLCKGDTITDVIYKLATELCDLMEMFELTNFDLSCLNIPVTSTPVDFKELMVILIARICANEGLSTSEIAAATECPDNCIVSIAECFQFTDRTGDLVTTMTLQDYVQTIGHQLCNTLTTITTIQANVTALQNDIDVVVKPNLDELNNNAVFKSTLQYQVSTKTDTLGVTSFITNAVRLIENSLIATQDATGSPTELYQAILKENNLANSNKLFGTGDLNTIPGWITSPVKLSDSVNNMWLTLADIREAVEYVQNNALANSCSDIFLNFRATSIISAGNDIITIFTDGSTGFTDSWKQTGVDSLITVLDSAGNSTTFTADLINLISDPTGLAADITASSVDLTLDLIITATTSFINTDTNTTCEKDYVYNISANVNCPAVVLTLGFSDVTYQFTTVSGYEYAVSVYLAGGSIPIAAQSIANPGTTIVNTITGLLEFTDYELEISITNTAKSTIACPRIAFKTLIQVCDAPTNAVAILT